MCAAATSDCISILFCIHLFLTIMYRNKQPSKCKSMSLVANAFEQMLLMRGNRQIKSASVWARACLVPETLHKGRRFGWKYGNLTNKNYYLAGFGWGWTLCFYSYNVY